MPLIQEHEEFAARTRQLCRSVGLVISRVGPKGYIHGWIFVGAPGLGADVFHPHHGHGIVTGSRAGRVSVKFGSGTQEFEHGSRHGPPRLEPRPVPAAVGTPEFKEQQKLAGEANARGQIFLNAKAAAGRTWIHDATGLPTDLIQKLSRQAAGSGDVTATADKLFHEGDLPRAATLLEAEAEQLRRREFGRDTKAADALDAAAKRLRAAKIKDVPSGLGRVGRNPDGSIDVVDNRGVKYTIKLSADRQTVTVTGPGGTVSGPANGNPTAAARKLAHQLRGHS